MSDTPNKYDAFISHAAEDKDDFVRPMANLLSELGADIWYDEFSLRLGMSLSRSIDKGLSNSNYGIIVLSKAFFAKDWTEYELKSLNALEIGKDGVMLPIWHNVNREEVLKYSPYLADKLAVQTSQKSIAEIAIKILDVIRPDLSENYHKRTVWEEFSKPKGDEEIKIGKAEDFSEKVLFRHKSLPQNLLNRIRLIRASLLSVYPHSYEFWVDGFKCDLHPEREIEFWETISFSYLEITQATKLGPSEYPAIFQLVLCFFQGGITKANEKESKLPKDTIENIKKVCKNRVPYFEMKIDEKKWGKGQFEIDIYEQLNKPPKKSSR